jgi:dTDP-glucose 4,6-dehydratase
MNLLITGGAGFIGSNFIRYILNKYPDYKIINLDILNYCGNLENLRDIENNPNYAFVRGDICDERIVDKLISRKPDAIVHLAAESHVDRSILGPDEFLRTNVLGTNVLLKIARKYKIGRFIHIGTDEEYGSIKVGSFKELDNLNPSSPYSSSKAAASLLALAYFKTHNLPVIVTRASNNFGGWQHPEKLIPLFVTNLLEDKKVPIYGNGQQVRDWLYVIDNCAGIDCVLHHGQIGEIYNIGADNERTNLEITKIILEQLGKDESYIEYVEDRPGHDRRYAIDSTKLRNLGWQPRFEFEEAMAKTIQWYVNNETWWKKIKYSEHYSEYYKKQYQSR